MTITVFGARLSVFWGLLVAFGAPLGAQSTPATQRVLLVTIRDSEGRPLQDVGVSILEEKKRSLTDTGGRAVLFVSNVTRFTLEARRIGYQLLSRAVEISDDTTRVNLSLVALPQDLAKVTVRGKAEDFGARLAPFEARRQKNASGSFITRANLEKWQTAHLTDALRRMPGVKIVDSFYTKFAASSRSAKPVLRSKAPKSRGEIDLAPCIMRVGVDGFIKEPTFELDAFPVSEIHGVEIYPGPASIPPVFGGLRDDGYCGLVMIWTRSK